MLRSFVDSLDYSKDPYQLKDWELNKIKSFLEYRVEIDQQDCWCHIASKKRNTYGPINHRSTIIGAHVFFRQLFTGELAGSLMTLHLCDKRFCCNPDHLFLGTARDNVVDAIAKGRHKIIEDNLVRGLKGSQLSFSKLTEEDIPKIRLDNRSPREIAKDYRVVSQTISDIKSGRTWKHVR